MMIGLINIIEGVTMSVTLLMFTTGLWMSFSWETSNNTHVSDQGHQKCPIPHVHDGSNRIGNIRNKNADGMPTIMLLGGLACSSCWLLYGYLLDDPNVYVPNIPGLIITVVKLYIIQLYSGHTKLKRQ
ncbi:hypothetical protein LSH36_763g00003 [Paralvinella palmiformis]|uniref:Sugar transporter SWEET1 n=1 Tax=Paralvinella palmiformis TaxID=53620 RepID=A0AAD9J0L1_9ANNE|nr:hypothetical protein LSH36_763g00003 [Paralvinella palmiformis]